MARIKQFQYAKPSKKEDAVLFVLDDHGDIWYAENPFKQNIHWRRLELPFGLNEGDDDEEPEDFETEIKTR
jgi:hypothetical protein